MKKPTREERINEGNTFISTVQLTLLVLSILVVVTGSPIAIISSMAYFLSSHYVSREIVMDIKKYTPDVNVKRGYTWMFSGKIINED